jgi:hypothetical protein
MKLLVAVLGFGAVLAACQDDVTTPFPDGLEPFEENGVILGTPDDVQLGMIRHQKTQGSDFISLSEGSVQVLATPDPNVSELAFVEHLDAIQGGVGDLLKGMQRNYEALVALAHETPTPACP